MSQRSLEARDYVATKSDIETLARQNLEAARARMAVRATYLRALLATTQHELEKGEKPASKGEILDWQIATLEAVHTRFYEIVMATVVTLDIQDSPKLGRAESHRRALERNRRSGFARSAKSTLLSWLRIPGHDLRDLEAGQVTKSFLANDTPRGNKPLRPALVRQQTARAAHKLLRMTDRLVRVDEAAAVAILSEAVEKLSKFLLDLSGEPTRKPRVAMDEHRPLLTDTGVFMPVRKLRRRVA